MRHKSLNIRSPMAEIIMIHTYGAVAQIDDTGKPGTFTQWNCDCGKTTNLTVQAVVCNVRLRTSINVI